MSEAVAFKERESLRLIQLCMFGEPEDVTNLSADGRRRDDAPVPAERELLWPAPHAAVLGPELMEKLYGDLPRRTRLTILEVCRRLRCGHTHVYDMVYAGSLDATDDRSDGAQVANLKVYRYSLVRFLFWREFVEHQTRAGLPGEDLDRCMRLAEQLKKDVLKCRR